MSEGLTIIDLCQHPQGVIYDVGGPDHNYTNSFSGIIVLQAQAGTNIILTGDYNTERGYDLITVYDGYGTSGVVLFGPQGGTGSLHVASFSGYMTITFSSDYSNTSDGFTFQYQTSGTAFMCANAVSNVLHTPLSATSIRFDWSSSGGPPFYVSLDGGAPLSVNGYTHTFTGLTPFVTHTATLSSQIDSGNRCCTKEVLFRVGCAPIHRTDLPFRHGFEPPSPSTLSYTLDSCWTLLPATASPSCPFLLYSAEGVGSFNLKTSITSRQAILALPEYADTISQLDITWSMTADPYVLSSDKFIQVGVMDDPFDSSTFVPLGSFQAPDGGYQTFYQSFSSYTGAGHYIAFRLTGSNGSILIDDIQLSLHQRCPAISSIHVSQTNSTSAVLQWSLLDPDANNVSAFEIKAYPVAGGSPVVCTASHCPYLLSGLLPEHEYQVSVRPLCFSGSAVADTIPLITSCIGFRSPQSSSSRPVYFQPVPVSPNMGNSFSQTIYTATDLAALGLVAGRLNGITLTRNTSGFRKRFAIFLDTTIFNYYTGAQRPIDHAVKVYEGHIGGSGPGPEYFPFDTNFYWDGTSNLVLTLIVNQTDTLTATRTGFNIMSNVQAGSLAFHQTLSSSRHNVPYLYTGWGFFSNCTHSYFTPAVSFSMCDTTILCDRPIIILQQSAPTHLSISWGRIGSETSWEVAYQQYGRSNWTIANPACPDTFYTFYHLAKSTRYTFRIRTLCGLDTITTYFTAATQCSNNIFAYDDLYADNVTCHYGMFESPDVMQGVVDFGYGSTLSRHTIHTDTSETDPRTGNALHTVPPGYCSSVRLGNWNTHAQAESIVYTYTVDTNDFDLFLLKYAAVLEDPSHDLLSQPRFTFLITDLQGDTISPCYCADFIANSNLGWHANGSVLYKDWTTIGIDLSPLHGQTILIKLTTYDCKQGAHYGYAYFVIDLDNKNLLSDNCSGSHSTFFAPQGFAYSWYSLLSPSIILSTADTLHVTTPGSYCCRLSYLGAPNDAAHADCYFTISGYNGVRYPWARFLPVVHDSSSCSMVLMRMLNRSIVTRDPDHLDSIAPACETYLWRFDDSTTSTDINPLHPFSPGLHTATLFARLAGEMCSDSLQLSFVVPDPCFHSDTVNVQLCQGDTYRVFDTLLTTSGSYLLDSLPPSGHVYQRLVNITFNYRGMDTLSHTACDTFFWDATQTTYRSSGCYNDTLFSDLVCDSITTLRLTLNPSYTLSLHDTICHSTPYLFCSDTLAASGSYSCSLLSSQGCDSIVALQLFVRPPTIGDTAASVCDTFRWNNTLYTASVVDTAVAYAHDLHGCDSSVVLHLQLRRSSVLDSVVVCCDSFRWYGQLITDIPSPLPVQTFVNAAGCDSLVRLADLTIHRSSITTLADTVCFSTLADGYYWLDSLVLPAASLPDSAAHVPYLTHHSRHFTDAHSCDSTLQLALTVYPNTTSVVFDTIVQNQAPGWVYHGIPVPHDTAMMPLTIPNIAGCDSLILYNLHVVPNSHVVVDSSICQNHVASFLWHGLTTSVLPGATDTLHVLLTSSLGADSSVTLLLHCHPVSHIHLFDTLCSNQSITFADTTLLADSFSSGLYSHTIPSVHGCDSTVTLHLTVRQAYHFVHYDTIRYGDTLLFQSTPYAQPGTYTHAYTTVQGCDSLYTLVLHGIHIVHVARADTLCPADTIRFGRHIITAPGVYVDTVFMHNFFVADTIVTLTVVQLPYPDLLVDNLVLCTPQPHYRLAARSAVADSAIRFRWHIEPHASSRPFLVDDSVAIVPDSLLPASCLLSASYGPRGLCPVSLAVSLAPIPQVDALILTRPEVLTPEARQLTAFDISHGEQLGHWWQLFSRRQLLHAGDEPVLQYDVPINADSLIVTLIVQGVHCPDTDTAAVPVLNSSLYFPNVFTPSRTDNNLFHAFGSGVSCFEIWIYDRRGDLVFHSDDITQPWDGTHQGQPCPQAAYVYRCRYCDETVPGGLRSVTGTVTLLR